MRIICAVEQVWAAGKHKRRINCGAWSYQNQLAYGSDDKQISVTSETGQIQDQVRVRALSCLVSSFSAFQSRWISCVCVCVFVSCVCCLFVHLRGLCVDLVLACLPQPC